MKALTKNINDYLCEIVKIIDRNEKGDIIIQRTTQKINKKSIKFVSVGARKCDVGYENSEEDFRCIKEF